MNLSVGAIGGLVAISFSGVMEVYQVSVPIAICLGLAIGIICGLLNGYITVKSGISAFIITLATLYIFKGINLGASPCRRPKIFVSFFHFWLFSDVVVVTGWWWCAKRIIISMTPTVYIHLVLHFSKNRTTSIWRGGLISRWIKELQQPSHHRSKVCALSTTARSINSCVL